MDATWGQGHSLWEITTIRGRTHLGIIPHHETIDEIRRLSLYHRLGGLGELGQQADETDTGEERGKNNI
jgi:hypothetical protein